MTETFLWYREGRWFRIFGGALLVLILVYVWDSPIGGRSGSSWLGYLYGALATAGIGYLMWYGIRRRSYETSGNTLKGCLSAHAWLGVALALLVPLHSAFQFGANVHTLAYVLMMIVILSGIYGAFQYLNYAPLISAHRGEGHTPALLEQIQNLSKDIKALCRDKSGAFLKLCQATDFEFKPDLWRCLNKKLVPPFDQRAHASTLADLESKEQEDGLKLIGLVSRKREIALKLQENARILAKMRLWLWIHLPVSLALVVCVVVHIVLVLLYR